MLKNKKNIIISILSATIILIVYNVSIFLIVNNIDSNFWSGYLFTILGFFISCLVSFITLWSQKSDNQYFYAVPVIIASAIYCALQLLVGLLVIFIEYITITTSVILQTILLAGYSIIVLIYCFNANNSKKVKDNTESDRRFAKQLRASFELLFATADLQEQNMLKKIKEIIYYELSEISITSSKKIECEILYKMENLSDIVGTNNSQVFFDECKMIEQLLMQRNALCKNR